MNLNVVFLPGDGIGPEVGQAGLSVLEAVCRSHGHTLSVREFLVGGAAIDATGEPLPDATLKAAQDCPAVLLGAVGGPKWDDAPVRPEAGLLGLRKGLGVFANLRPVKPHERAIPASPLKPELLRDVDLVVVRELTGGIYFGDKSRTETTASDLCTYSKGEIERVVRMAATLAKARRGKLTSVDKANVLETSRLWRSVTSELMAREFPDVALDHVLVDAAAMHLLSRPASFDVIVTENMFGDILTDEASMLAGSMGLLPSASLSAHGPGLYEPIHGSAPDIAGQGLANPLAMILSIAMMLEHAFKLRAEAGAIRAAVDQALQDGQLTPDLGGSLTTDGVARAVAERLESRKVQAVS